MEVLPIYIDIETATIFTIVKRGWQGKIALNLLCAAPVIGSSGRSEAL